MNNTDIIGIRRRMNAGYTVRISEVMELLDALETAQKELSVQRVAFQNCMGTTNEVSTQMNARLQAIREYMQTDPDYGVYDGVLSRSELQLFFDEIARLIVERDAEKRRADAAIYDLEWLGGKCEKCELCSHFTSDESCEIEDEPCVFKWRGPCAENAPTGAESEADHAE